MADRVRYGTCTSAGCAITVLNRVAFDVPGWSPHHGGFVALVAADGTVRKEHTREIVDVPPGHYRALYEPPPSPAAPTPQPGGGCSRPPWTSATATSP
jgi:hypothetical protein